MITQLDLTQFATQKLVLEWIRMPQVQAVFMAPPCGTASKARTIQLEGVPNLPQPLRTLEQPDGVENLSDTDFQRVEQSNMLYDFSAECYDECCRLDKLFVCENPKDSLYWFVTPWQERAHKDMDHEQIHQAWAHGSSRPKWTKLVGNFPEIYMVNKLCPGTHQHEPWGVQQIQGKRTFATSLEVHYPPLLCDAIANAIALALQRRGFQPATVLPLAQAARAFSNVQANSSKLPTLVPEFNTSLQLLPLKTSRCGRTMQYPRIANSSTTLKWGEKMCSSCALT